MNVLKRYIFFLSSFSLKFCTFQNIPGGVRHNFLLKSNPIYFIFFPPKNMERNTNTTLVNSISEFSIGHGNPQHHSTGKVNTTNSSNSPISFDPMAAKTQFPFPLGEAVNQLIELVVP
jgi:hypothetical protein